MPRPWCARGCIGAGGRSSSPTQHGRDAAHQGFFDLLRTNKVNMRVDAACRENVVLSSNNFGARTNHNIDARLNVWVSGFPDPSNSTIF